VLVFAPLQVWDNKKDRQLERNITEVRTGRHLGTRSRADCQKGKSHFFLNLRTVRMGKGGEVYGAYWRGVESYLWRLRSHAWGKFRPGFNNTKL